MSLIIQESGKTSWLTGLRKHLSLTWTLTTGIGRSQQHFLSPEPLTYAVTFPLSRTISPQTRSILFRGSAALSLFISNVILKCGNTKRIRAMMNDLWDSRCRLCESTIETPEHLWTCSGCKIYTLFLFPHSQNPVNLFSLDPA